MISSRKTTATKIKTALAGQASKPEQATNPKPTTNLPGSADFSRIFSGLPKAQVKPGDIFSAI